MSYQTARRHAVHVSYEPNAVLRRSSQRLFKRILVVCIAALGLIGQSLVNRANAEERTRQHPVLHTYGNSQGHEVANVIAVRSVQAASAAAVRIHHRSRFEPIVRETRSGNRDHRQL